MFTVDQIDHVALTVSDVAQSAAWYADVLGLERRYAEARGDVPTVLCAGSTCVALFGPRADQALLVAHEGMRHIAFRVDRVNLGRAQEAFRQRGIAWTFEDYTICHSIYFADPDGYRLEITTYDLA